MGDNEYNKNSAQLIPCENVRLFSRSDSIAGFNEIKNLLNNNEIDIETYNFYLNHLSPSKDWFEKKKKKKKK